MYVICLGWSHAAFVAILTKKNASYFLYDPGCRCFFLRNLPTLLLPTAIVLFTQTTIFLDLTRQCSCRNFNYFFPSEDRGFEPFYEDTLAYFLSPLKGKKLSTMNPMSVNLLLLPFKSK